MLVVPIVLPSSGAFDHCFCFFLQRYFGCFSHFLAIDYVSKFHCRSKISFIRRSEERSVFFVGRLICRKYLLIRKTAVKHLDLQVGHTNGILLLILIDRRPYTHIVSCDFPTPSIGLNKLWQLNLFEFRDIFHSPTPKLLFCL